MSQDTPITFDADKFELIHQVGGIRTATFDGLLDEKPPLSWEL